MKIIQALLELVVFVLVIYWIIVTGFTLISFAAGLIVISAALNFIEVFFKSKE